MTRQLMFAPGEGTPLAGRDDAVVTASLNDGAFATTIITTVAPGFDVGAHLHHQGQEMFYVIEGELDIVAFEPLDRSVPDWHEWRSASGQTYLRGGPGSFMWVPENTPHAFANTTNEPARMFFQSSVAGGHENYLNELSELLRSGGFDQQAVRELRRRYDIEQLTAIAR